MAGLRGYRLALPHVKAGGVLRLGPGEVVVQGRTLGFGWPGSVWGDRLMPVQRYLLEALGIIPDDCGQAARPVRRSQDELWRNMVATRQFHAREGCLRVPREHREQVEVGGEVLGLGPFVANARRRGRQAQSAAPGGA